jgi:hypothetical protein
MYFRDHPPPHVHVVTADTEALVEIESGEIFAGVLPRHYAAEALAWIGHHRADLRKRWVNYQK